MSSTINLCRHCLIHGQTPRRGTRVVVCARNDRPENPNAPKRGYFAEADPKAPVYKPKAGQGSGDVTKRGGRWESDFIWNTNWQDRMDYEAQTAEQQRELKRKGPEQDSGFLSFSRVSDLNSMDVDLSEQLTRKREPEKPAVPTIQMVPSKRRTTGAFAEVPPSPAEAKRWQRASGYTKRSNVAQAMIDAGGEKSEEEAAREQLETERYEQLKREYSLWTAATVAVCGAAVYAFYTRDIAASYLIGALGGIVYLRLLNRSVDAFAAQSLGAAAGGAASQPRLLIPVILVLTYNRFNQLYSESLHLHLELLPMLAGFFTYKVGVVGRSAVSVFREITGTGEEGRAAQQPEQATRAVSASAADDVTSVDRAFVKNILTK